MQAPGGKLTQKQEALIAALLSAPSIETAAQQTGINPVTAWRWMKQPAFATAYRDARRAAVQHAVVLAQRFCATAVGTLVAVATDQHAPASARVTAARSLLEFSLRAVEVEDLQARIEALEHGGQGR